MKTQVMMHPRAEELLVERAIRPLDATELAELEAFGVGDDDSLDRAAAALAIGATPYEAMPADVFARLADRFDPPVQVAPPAPIASIAVAREQKAARRAPVVVAWMAAAAGVAVAIGTGLWARSHVANSGTPSTPVAQAPKSGRAALLAAATDAKPLDWTATTDAAATGATGDVVWSAAQQQGYMRFVGLATNDPGVYQYQLWIFDGTRDAAYPIDGGVFDVSSTGEVIVPISAKLHVNAATLFAVTIEKPGGVVVSKRERIVVTAKPA